MSNLAYKFMQAGSLKQADEELQNALKVKDFHRNVGEALAALKDITGDEDTKLREALKKAEQKRQFFNSLGAAATQPDVTQLPEKWNGPDCELTVAIDKDNFSATGEFERPANALSSYLTSEQKPASVKVTYKGKIRGHRVIWNFDEEGGRSEAKRRPSVP